jgi:hypothetical protein
MRRVGIGPGRRVHGKSIFCARTDACGTNVPAISLSRLPNWRLALSGRARYFLGSTQSRKEGRAMMTIFRHYRQRGPVNALQMRLQG